MPLYVHMTPVTVCVEGLLLSIRCQLVMLSLNFSPERFTKVLLEQQQDRARREQERIRLLTADPFDLEAQAKIEEDIRYSPDLWSHLSLRLTLLCWGFLIY